MPTKCKLLIGGTYGGTYMFCTVIYAYKSIFCNDYLIELGPPFKRFTAIVVTNWTPIGHH
jgi:hypothetical protein